MTINVPDALAERLKSEAEAQRRQVQDLALSILEAALGNQAEDDLKAVVARIQALPVNPHAVRVARGSLADALAAAPPAAAFDLDAWQRDWQAVETEAKARDRADDVAEGRS